MNQHEALRVLEQYQLWRRDVNESGYEMPQPWRIGQALDVAIAALQNRKSAEIIDFPNVEAAQELLRLYKSATRLAGMDLKRLQKAQYEDENGNVHDYLHLLQGVAEAIGGITWELSKIKEAK